MLLEYSSLQDLAASSDSDLLKSAPPWCMAQPKTKFRIPSEKDQTLSDSSRTVSSQEGEEAAQGINHTFTDKTYEVLVVLTCFGYVVI